MHVLDVAGDRLEFELKRTGRSTLGISVLPDGQVRVTAPQFAELEDIQRLVRKRAGWIYEKREQALRSPDRLPARRYVPGETHYFLGRQYRLRVDPDTIGVRRDGDRIVVGGVQAHEWSRIRNRLVRWYGRQAREILYGRLEANMARFRKEIGTQPKLKILPLGKRWGSFVRGSRSLVLNSLLVQAAPPEIDYVIVHELCHVAVPTHGPAFLALLGEKMPDWRARKANLEQLGIH
jgi:predicted metal-dependent hydrolase